jgi:hypothetical protein
MAAKLKIEKRGGRIKNKSSPLKLLSQFHPNFAEMILGWSPSKIVAGISYEMPDINLEGTTQGSFQLSLVGIGSVVSEEKILF